MRRSPFYLSILALVSLSSPVLSQPCDDVQAAVKAKIDGVQKEYEGKLKDKQAEIDGWQKQLEKETPHPSQGGAAIGFDVETKWTDKEIIFGVPSVTLHDQNINPNLPDITIKQQTWIWNKPVFWVGTTKCGQKPETVCESKRGGPPFYLPGIECYVKWTDIFCDLPQTKLEETKTILGVPEFSMRQQQIIMGIPEFTMQQTKIVLRLPEITVKNVKVEIQKAKERADSFQRQANDSLGTLSAEMRARIETSTLGEMSKVFDCQRTDLRNKEAVALGRSTKTFLSSRRACVQPTK